MLFWISDVAEGAVSVSALALPCAVPEPGSSKPVPARPHPARARMVDADVAMSHVTWS